MIFFLLITGALGLRSCGGDVKPDSRTPAAPSLDGMKIEKLNIGEQGIEISGKAGEKILIGKDGASVTGRDGKTVRSNATGKTERKKKNIPVSMLLWALYGALLVWRFGATPGKMILKLKVVDFVSGEKPGADKAFLRAFFSLASLFLLLGYAWAIWEKDKRTWHDIIAGTRVIDSGQ